MSEEIGRGQVAKIFTLFLGKDIYIKSNRVAVHNFKHQQQNNMLIFKKKKREEKIGEYGYWKEDVDSTIFSAREIWAYKLRLQQGTRKVT